MPSYLYTIKDYEMNGGLVKYLKESRKLEKSYRTMADELSQLGVIVSKSTVSNWIQGLDL